MPKALYHWSKATPGTFESNSPRFKVNTQGRVYTVKNRKTRFGTTIALQPKSLLIFLGEGTLIFERHPWLTLFIYKSLAGQYWSRRFGDVVWDRGDAIGHGNVWLIFKAKIVPIDDKERSRRQRMKVAGRITQDVVYLTVILALTYLLWEGEKFSDTVLAFERNHPWFTLGTMSVVALVLLWALIWGGWQVYRDTKPLDVDKDLQAALQKAKAQSRLSEDFDL